MMMDERERNEKKKRERDYGGSRNKNTHKNDGSFGNKA
jgi:hypothetical protein